MMKKIAFYISGHGYGHATRCIEILKRLTLTDHFFCHIKSNAPEWLFKLNLSKNFEYHYFFNDIGTVQRNWLQVDKQTTLAAFSELWQDKLFIVNRELDFIRNNEIQFILGDIPPIAFEIANAAGIPGLAMGNFCWDWIYAPYIAEFPEYAHVIDNIRAAYAHSQILFRLPFSGDMSVFPNIKDVPLVGRLAQQNPEEVRRKLPLNIDTDKKIILIAFRQNDLARIDLERLKELDGFYFIAFSRKGKQDQNLCWLPHDYMPFQELVNAADAVVSKLGYGIVSECVVNQTPLFFSERYDFMEHDVLRGGLERNGVGGFIPLKDFLAGNWDGYLKAYFNRTIQWPALRTDGAEVISEYLLQM